MLFYLNMFYIYVINKNNDIKKLINSIFWSMAVEVV